MTNAYGAKKWEELDDCERAISARKMEVRFETNDSR